MFCSNIKVEIGKQWGFINNDLFSKHHMHSVWFGSRCAPVLFYGSA